MTQGKRTFRPVTSRDVFQIYELIHKEGLIAFPITLEGEQKIEAIISNINGSYEGVPFYATPAEKAVAHLYFLIKDHPFIDGNKRTASLVFAVVCNLNELRPDYQDFTLDSLAVFIEKIQEADHQGVIKQIAQSLFDN